MTDPIVIRAVLDANVLYPGSLRDTLLRLAEAGYYEPFWSQQILDEMDRNLLAKAEMTSTQVERLLRAIQEAFPEAMVTGYEELIDKMPNDEKDRHVTAVAVVAVAQVIVTNNLKDFQELPAGIEAQSPSKFLECLFELDPDSLAELIREQATALRQPPMTFDELLVNLEKIVPGFVQAVREHVA